MIKIRLQTREGQYIITAFIPPFNKMPDCVIWGNRFFFFRTDDIYVEGFAVATAVTAHEIVSDGRGTVTDLTKNDTSVPKIETEPIGNDDVLFGLPKDLDEAIETFLDYYNKAVDMKSIVDMSEENFTSYAHHGSGQFMRNSWYLWWHEGHQYKEWPKTKPAIVAFFNELGIYHADDMSSIILHSAFRKVNNQPIELEKQVQHFKNFWKQQGFSDGIYKNKK